MTNNDSVSRRFFVVWPLFRGTTFIYERLSQKIRYNTVFINVTSQFGEPKKTFSEKANTNLAPLKSRRPRVIFIYLKGGIKRFRRPCTKKWERDYSRLQITVVGEKNFMYKIDVKSERKFLNENKDSISYMSFNSKSLYFTPRFSIPSFCAF